MRIVFMIVGWLLFPAEVDAADVILLSQTSCQFVEAEGVDHQYSASSAEQCKTINATTAEKRLAAAEPLRLKAGSYIFRVSNKNVPYTLGFWLRGAGISRLSLPGISGGGIGTGEQRDYEIHLLAGEYRYSCPLNPTPDYVLIVE